MRGGWAAGRKDLARWYQPPAQKVEAWTHFKRESGGRGQKGAAFPEKILRKAGEESAGLGQTRVPLHQKSLLTSHPLPQRVLVGVQKRLWPREPEVGKRKAQLGPLLQDPLRTGDPPRVLASPVKWAPRLPTPELLLAILENLSRYAQQMSLGRPSYILFIRVHRTDMRGGKKIFRGWPGGLGFLREGGQGYIQ